MAERCGHCGARLGGVEHSNGNLGRFSFSEACDDCQQIAHAAFRLAKAQETARKAALVASGGAMPSAIVTAPLASSTPDPAPPKLPSGKGE